MADSVHSRKPPDSSREVLAEEAFRRVLAKETSRATRYQHFFSVCLLKPNVPDSRHRDARVRRAVSKKVAEFLRSTDVVGDVQDGTAVLLLHTASPEALRVAERIRARIERVVFPAGPRSAPRQITLSVGEVSFPRDGYNDRVLLARARAHMEEAARRGGDHVLRSDESTA